LLSGWWRRRLGRHLKERGDLGGKAPRRGGVGHGRRRRGGLRLGYVMEEEEGLTGGPGASAGGERSCAARRRLEPGARLGRGKEQRGRKKTGVRDGPSANWASAVGPCGADTGGNEPVLGFGPSGEERGEGRRWKNGARVGRWEKMGHGQKQANQVERKVEEGEFIFFFPIFPKLVSRCKFKTI